MINEKIGNLLTAEEVDVIAHQTNYAGVMAGGIAKSIKNDLLGAKGFFEYTNTCDTQKRNLLGTVLYQTAVNGKIVADMFAQRNHGRVRTDYDALQKCLEDVEIYCSEKGIKIRLCKIKFIHRLFYQADYFTLFSILCGVYRKFEQK